MNKKEEKYVEKLLNENEELQHELSIQSIIINKIQETCCRSCVKKVDKTIKDSSNEI